MDQENPYMIDLADDDSSQPYLQQLVWGHTFTFRVSWSPSHTPSTKPYFTHQFVVTEYWDDDLYMYQHTFQKDFQFTHVEKETLTGEGIKNDLKTRKVLIQDDSEGIHVHPISTSADTCDQSQDSCHGGNVHIVTEDQSASSKENLAGQLEGSCDSNNCDTTSSHSKYSQHQNQNHKPGDEADTFTADKIVDGDGNIILKILSFNLWNTNVVRGGSKSYIKRIQQLAKVSIIQLWLTPSL